MSSHWKNRMPTTYEVTMHAKKNSSYLWLVRQSEVAEAVPVRFRPDGNTYKMRNYDGSADNLFASREDVTSFLWAPVGKDLQTCEWVVEDMDLSDESIYWHCAVIMYGIGFPVSSYGRHKRRMFHAENGSVDKVYLYSFDQDTGDYCRVTVTTDDSHGGLTVSVVLVADSMDDSARSLLMSPFLEEEMSSWDAVTEKVVDSWISKYGKYNGGKAS